VTSALIEGFWAAMIAMMYFGFGSALLGNAMVRPIPWFTRIRRIRPILFLLSIMFYVMSFRLNTPPVLYFTINGAPILIDATALTGSFTYLIYLASRLEAPRTEICCLYQNHHSKWRRDLF
jgi:uncharacterized membrane protein YedE/YeeE